MDTLEILEDSVRVYHVSRHGENSWTDKMRTNNRREGDHFHTLGIFIWSVWIFPGKKSVSVEGCFLGPLTVSGSTVMGWHLLSPIVLRRSYCLYDQSSLFLVGLFKGSEGRLLYGTLDPDIICT